MANFTKNAIKKSFMKLLSVHPLHKISVRDIVEDCGINRNSFYYHFQSIPNLIEEIIKEEANNIIEKYPTINSMNECFNAVFQFALENKNAVHHIYNSANRDIYERHMMKLCEYVVTAYIDTVFTDNSISDSDRKILIRFIKCECFGACIDWILDGMKDTAIEELHRLTELCRSFFDGKKLI